MAKLKDISDVLEGLPGIVEAFPSLLGDHITQIELSNRGKNVDIKLRLPLDILKNPKDVREFDGVPLLVLLNIDDKQITRKAKVKKGWEREGSIMTVLGSSQEINGMMWTPVVFDGEEDPTWHKTTSIEMIK